VALDDPKLPIAETWRKVCEEADRLMLPLPGYDTIRLVVRERRRQREEIRRLLEPVVADACAAGSRSGISTAWSRRRSWPAACRGTRHAEDPHRAGETFVTISYKRRPDRR
jgi:hypothetical protein